MIFLVFAIHNFSGFFIIYLLGIRRNFRPIFSTRYHLCYLLIFSIVLSHIVPFSMQGF